MRNKVVNLHAINPRILVNLPLILVKTLANLLVKPTELRVRGGHGGFGSGEYTWERLVRSPILRFTILGPETMRLVRLMRLLWDYLLGILLGIARNITRNITSRFADDLGLDCM